MTDASRPERAPAGAGPAGRKLWRAVVVEYELQEHELLLLREAVRTADLLDELEATVIDRCKVLMQQPEAVRGRALFHWWPKEDTA